jgi:hypothetical protein
MAGMSDIPRLSRLICSRPKGRILEFESDAVFPPQAGKFAAIFDPVRTVTFGVVLFTLYGPDEIRFLHAEGIDPCGFCHFLNVLEFHGYASSFSKDCSDKNA